MIARSTPWGTIQFGEAFYALSEPEQCAIIAHEQGHIHHRHALKRLAWLLTLRAVFRPEAFFAMCETQELEADRYAVERGHAAGLISFLFRSNLHVKSPGYPTTKHRLENIHG
eukprot:gnl/Spiro4/26025_TR12964_c0_g1_i1.p2 gnl/Spiro4/26025_TR12964_c0_g1~~gnl/Spiro4/26025_TR12964_c0_g1_i1.p2  ORF type:complete len:113 (+),score=20.97 gnl/Spiro4/26025_TR12964_c0_g1_i1:125-463(+)